MKGLLVRPSRNEEDADALLQFGIESTIIPLIGISNFYNPDGVAKMLSKIQQAEKIWFIATSSNAIDAFISQADRDKLSLAFSNPNLRFAAVGDASASSLKAFSSVEVLVPDVHDALSLAQAMIEAETRSKNPEIRPSVVMPIGSRSLVVAQEKLALEGFEVLAEIVYQNLPLPLNDLAKTEVSSEAVDFVLFRSPSSAKAYFDLQGLPSRLVISVGATTTAAIRELGFSPDLVCLETSPSSVAKKIAEYQAKRMSSD